MTSLLLSVFLVTVLIVVTSAGGPIHEECIKSFAVQKDILDKAHKKVFEDDDTFKQYLVCVATKSGFVGDDGSAIKDKLREAYADKFEDSSALDEVLEKCDEKKETVEDTVFFATTCFFKNSPDTVQFNLDD